jgi:riboflavin-specific deaminase-like protein
VRLRRLYPEPGEVDLDSLPGELDFASRASEERPYVVANFVASLDGKVAVKGRSGPLGGEADKALFQALRKTVDCVLVGAGTVRKERYGKMTPLAAILTGRLDLPMDTTLFSDPSSRVAVYTATARRMRPVAADVTLHRIARADLTVSAVLRSLYRDHGVRSVLCEGGPSVLYQLAHERVLDELFLTLSPTLVGGEDEPSLLRGGAELDPPERLSLRWLLQDGAELFLRYGG